MATTIIPTEAEYPFLNMLNGLSGSTKGVVVLYLKLSALSPVNKMPQKIKAFSEQIRDDALKTGQIAAFILSNQDAAFVMKNQPADKAEDIIRRVRLTFQGDRALYDSKIDLAHIYRLESDFAAIKAVAEQREAEHKRSEKSAAPAKTVPLAPEHLDAILRNIQGFNILRLIRRQEAIQLGAGGFSGLFLEYFTSTDDLKKAIAPDVNVLSNRWLFQYLSETLDKRMLGISGELFAHTPKKLSLNLNISTLFTPMFEDFLAQMPDHLKMVVEVRLMDAIRNTRSFMTARDLLHETGNEILIDGLTPDAFDFINMNLFEPDFVKLNWPFKGLNAQIEASLKRMIETFPADKVILMRVENEDTLKWGLSHGIDKFQGYFIDSLSAAVCRKLCPSRAKCASPARCIACKARISGAVRTKCLENQRLDRSLEDNLKG